MILRNITLNNYGLFRGEHKIDLTTSPGKPIVLVGGKHHDRSSPMLSHTLRAAFLRQAEHFAETCLGLLQLPLRASCRFLRAWLVHGHSLF